MTEPASPVSPRRKRGRNYFTLGGYGWLGICFLATVASSLRAGAAGCSAVATNVVGWWPGDGNATDIVGTNNGSLQGGATASASGFVGSAFSFDGTNSVVQIPDSAVFHLTNLTIEAWVRFSSLDSLSVGNSPAGDQYIVFKENSRDCDNFEGFDLSKTRFGSTDVFRFLVASASGQEIEIDSTSPLTTNVWYHIAGVRGSNFTQIYFNGQLQGQTNMSFPQDYGTLPLFFGTSGRTCWDHKLNGTLDEVTLYNRALTSNEISAIYAAGAAGKCKAVNIPTPPTNQTVVQGSNVSFTVGATGLAPLSYQWQFNGENLAGQSGTSLNLSGVVQSNGGNYTVVVTNKLGAVTSAVAVLTVLVPPGITTPPQSLTVVQGQNASFSVLASGSPPLSYQWWFGLNSIPGATGSSYTRTNAQPADGGSYTVVVTNAAGAVTSAVATLTVNVPPTISGQPQSLTVVQGQNATFTVSADGTGPLSYQWRLNSNNISGATGSSYTRTNAQPADAGGYTVVVGNVAGAITSAVATLTVNVPPAISGQPQSLTVVQGQNATFSVTASGTPPPSYQWRFGPTSIAGATGSSYTRTNAQPTDVGNYSVVVTNVAGAVTSTAASLTVNVPPSIIGQPQSLTVVQGQNATFTVSASGTTPLSYQWWFGASTIPGATGSSFTRTNAQPTDVGNYSVVVTNVAGAVTSAAASLTVNVPPSITAQPQNTTVIQGQDATFNVTANGTPPLSYQWWFGTSSIAGATTSSYTRTNTQPGQAGPYSVVISNVAGAVTSAAATLTVNGPPTILGQPQSLTVTQGQNAAFSVSAGGTQPLSYQWRSGGTPIGGATASSFTRTNAQSGDAGPYSVVITNVAGVATSSSANLTVLVPAAISSQPQSQTVTQGVNVTFTVAASGTPPFSYQWRFNGNNIGGQTGTSLALNNVQTSSAGGYSVAVANVAGSITSATGVLTVLVPPVITAQPTSQTGVAGSNVMFSVSTIGVPSPQYRWRLNGTNISGATRSSLTLTNIQPTNAGSYTVAVTNTAGAVISSAATLNVLLPPTFTSQPGSQANVTGTGASFNASVTGSPPLNYQWRLDGVNLVNDGRISGATSPNLSIATVQPGDAGNYTLVASNPGTAATSAVATLTVTLSDLVLIADPNLEAAIRSTLSKPNGSLFSSNMLVLTNLFASYRQISSLSGLEWATNLGALYLSGNGINSLTPLRGLSRLNQLVADRNRVSDLSKLAALTALTNLNVGDNLITDGAGLSGLTNLSGLWLNGNSIASLTFLPGLNRLRTLSLDGNLIGDYTPVSGLTNLATLSLRSGSLASAAVLQNLKQLVSLDVYNNSIADVSPVTGLTGLTSLDVRLNPITNYSGLASLTNLTRLCVGWNATVSSLTFAQNLRQLTWLDCGYNSVSDLSPLAGLTNLSYLVLSGNPASNYDVLSNLTGLVNLELRGNSMTSAGFLTNLTRLAYADLFQSVTNLPPLGRLTNLSSVVLAGVSNYSGLTNLNLTNLWVLQSTISDAGFFTNLSRLSYLILDDNAITSVTPLAGMKGLAGLGLSRNPVSDYTPLAGLTNLSGLWLEGNGISNLSAMAGLTRLQTLSLRSDHLGSLGALSGLTNLASMSATYNVLTNITALTNLPRLYWVELAGNLLDTNAGSLAMASIQSLSNRGVNVSYVPQNQPPSLSVSTNWMVVTNATSSLAISVFDDLTSGDRLVIATNSSNPGLIPNASISVAGTNSERTLTVTPAANQTGSSVITLIVTDEAGLSTNATVTVNVIVPQLVTIADTNLEAAIRERLNKPSGSLNNVDLQGLTDLFLLNANVASLSGLEWATHLSSLLLNGNAISDLSPLQNLYGLTYLLLDQNRISDLSPLNGLTNLNVLSLAQNRLSNIGPLLNLPQLSYVDVRLNLLDLAAASPAQTVIQTLTNRGVAVLYYPQRQPPTITVKPTWAIPANQTSWLSFLVTDNAQSSDQLTMSRNSSNPALVPNGGIVLSFYSNQDWTMSVSPAANQTGTTTITLTSTNDIGLGTSANVLVSVFLALPLDGQLFDNTNLTWSGGGNTPWFGQSVVTHSGVSAAQSGAIGDGQESWLQTTVTGPGPLTFWWKVSSETNYDFLEFYVNGVLQSNSISGEVDWEQQTYALQPGSQTLRWRYTKDKDTNTGSDAGWLDDVSFVALSWLQIAGPPTNGQCQLLLYGTPGKLYEIQTSSDLINWSSLGVVALTNSPMIFLDTNPGGASQYYRLRELPPEASWLDKPMRVGNTIQWVLYSAPGRRFEVQGSTNLVSWSPLAVITNNSGTVQYSEPMPASSSRCYYRAKALL